MIVQLDIFNDAPRQNACKACGKPCGKQSTCSAKCRDAYGQLCARDKAFKKRPQLKCVPCLYKVGFGCKSAARVLFLTPDSCANQARRLGLKVNSTAARVRFLKANAGRGIGKNQMECEEIMRRAKAALKHTAQMFGCVSPSQTKEAIARRYRNRYANDPAFNIKVRLRRRLKKFVKQENRTPSSELCSCSFQFLKSHLEDLFKPGMSWENYGEWHIDHIVPCSAFNLSDKLEQRRCFHWLNLQPLWAKENLLKSNKKRYWDDGCKVAGSVPARQN